MENENYKIEIIKDIKAKNDYFAKIEIVGDLEVGKSSILRRLIHNDFQEEYSPTEGYKFNPYLIKINNSILKLQIWDMCGKENYRPFLLNLYRNALVGILVYSVCSRESFNNLENWVISLKKYALPGSVIILLGNKCDDNEKREVTYEEGKLFCEKNNLKFFQEVSAKNGFSSPNFIEYIAKLIYKEHIENKNESNQSLNHDYTGSESILLYNDKKKIKGGACC